MSATASGESLFSTRLLAVIFTALLAPFLIADDRSTATSPLSSMSSRFLQSHADDPVHWCAFDDAAFERAAHLDRPLFVSIGTFSDADSRDMHRRSFRDPVVVALLNDHFVPVLVDAEDRPDLVAAYAQVIEGIGRAESVRGGSAERRTGWPLTIYQSPSGLPFFGATYLPATRQPERRTLRQSLTAVLDAWRSPPVRKRIAAQAQGIIDRLPSGNTPFQDDVAASLIPPGARDLTVAALRAIDAHDEGRLASIIAQLSSIEPRQAHLVDIALWAEACFDVGRWTKRRELIKHGGELLDRMLSDFRVPTADGEPAGAILLNASPATADGMNDAKFVLGWNAIAVSALAKGAILLERSSDRARAVRMLAMLDRRLAPPERFFRCLNGDQVAGVASLADAALLAKAHLDVYEIDYDSRDIRFARAIVQHIDDDFGAAVRSLTDSTERSARPAIARALLRDAAEDAHLRWAPAFDVIDGRLPAGNPTLIRVLLRLAVLNDDVALDRRTRRMLSAAQAGRRCSLCGHAAELELAMLEQRLECKAIIIIAGDAHDADTQALLTQARKLAVPVRVVVHRGVGRNGDEAAVDIGILRRSTTAMRSAGPRGTGARAFITFAGRVQQATTVSELHALFERIAARDEE